MSRLIASASKITQAVGASSAAAGRALTPKYADLLSGHRIPISEHDNRSLTTTPNPTRAPLSAPSAYPAAPTAFVDQVRLPDLSSPSPSSDWLLAMPISPDTFHHHHPPTAQSPGAAAATPTPLTPMFIAAAHPEAVAPGGMTAVHSLGADDGLFGAAVGGGVATNTADTTTTTTTGTGTTTMAAMTTMASSSLRGVSEYMGPVSGFWESVMEDILGPDYNNKKKDK